jgi:heptaprenyl diphosphate synthase
MTSGTEKALIPQRQDVLIAWLTALAITIHIAEAALPPVVPGIKPGLANIVTVVSFILFGWRVAAWVILLRVLVGSLLLGTFLSPTFILSFCGGISVLAVLGLVKLSRLRLFSAFGLSILMAIAHISGQFWVAYWLFIPHSTLLNLYPVLVTAAFFMGTLSGLITLRLLKIGQDKINSRLKSLT